MFPFIKNDPHYDEALERGIDIAESYFALMIREFYREVKKGSLKRKMRVTTVSSHKCNCEFCWSNEPRKV